MSSITSRFQGMTRLGEKVSLVRVQSSEEVKDTILRALRLIEFSFDKSERLVAIKPNLCYYWDSSTGCTTDPEIVAGIIDLIREKCGENVNIKIVEADATAMRAKLAFLTLGYERLAQEKEVELLNLSDDSTTVEKVSVNDREIEFEVPQLLLKADLFINVPKLKTIRMTRVSCAMKNVFGCIAQPRKISYHHLLNDAIVGINKILHPHLTIVDGLVALGRFPIKLGLIMASRDAFSIDWVASKIMGYKPLSLEFLKTAIKENVGYADGISIQGANLDGFKRIFPKEGLPRERLWAIQIGLLKMYSRIVKDVIPPVLQ